MNYTLLVGVHGDLDNSEAILNILLTENFMKICAGSKWGDEIFPSTIGELFLIRLKKTC